MCSFGDLDLDPAAVWRETPRRARKAHDCDGCGALIAPGEAYLDHFNVFEGEHHSEACCFSCWFAREQFNDAHDGHSFQPSTLWQALQDCVGENDDPEDIWRPVLAGLKKRFRTSAAGRRDLRRKWCAPRQPSWRKRERSPWEEWELAGHWVAP